MSSHFTGQSPQRILILGAGGHGQQVADTLWQAHHGGSNLLPIGYLDDTETLQGQRFLDLPVLGRISDRKHVVHDAIIVAIGDNRVRQLFFTQAQQDGENCIVARHPSAIVAPDVIVGAGTVISAGVIISTGVIIGTNVILNCGATIGHHSCLADHVHIGPGAQLGGGVTVGEMTMIGIGAIVMPQRWVGNRSVIGAGALVHDDVPSRVVVVGVPAKIMKHTSEL